MNFKMLGVLGVKTAPGVFYWKIFSKLFFEYYRDEERTLFKLLNGYFIECTRLGEIFCCYIFRIPVYRRVVDLRAVFWFSIPPKRDQKHSR